MPSIRPAVPEDAAALAAALLRNRAFMRPWEPRRTEAYYTAEGQAARLADGGIRWFAVEAETGGGGETGEDGETIVGAATLSGIALGPFRSASLGYWVDSRYTGRGLASALVREACRAAREDLGLHRVEAGTVLDNHASQRVLAKSGFERIGTAPRYLHIDGAWRDHHLYQRVLHDEPPPR
ncbi:GNAT family protein [Streptomyces sp. NBC_01216]|uniref:GNAT family N-acetyltransferase n=1 Tax=unclassified Streptomyces TaxID=2593676 RepID=UPI002E12E2F3|nr:GNAT family N-acetyltransferase [Streptomyces sp. NBC_01216]